jgi:hypothetical protein
VKNFLTGTGMKYKMETKAEAESLGTQFFHAVR